MSHDRAFLNNVVSSTLALEGDGSVKEYDGGYDDYLRQRRQAVAEMAAGEKRTEKVAKPTSVDRPSTDRPVKLSYKQQREVESLPQQIESLEQQQTALHAAMADPEFFKQDGDAIAQATDQLESIQRELGKLYARWEELESRFGS